MLRPLTVSKGTSYRSRSLGSRERAFGLEQARDGGVARLPGGPDLLPRALPGVLVWTEPQKARAVPEAIGFHLVVADLAHDLGADLDPFEVFPLGPTAHPAGHAAVTQVAGLDERRQPLLEVLLQVAGDPRGVADEIERAVIAIEAEQKARDARAVLPVAHDHAVGRLVVLHFHDGLAGPRLVGEIRALTDDAVEPDHLEALEPPLREGAVLRLGRERERGRA